VANTIYTPVTLWENFSIDLPIEEEIIKEYEKDRLVYRKTFFSGRVTGAGKVRIYALAAFDKRNAKMPAVLILPNYSKSADEATVGLFARRGYFAFMIDYAACGESGECTVYPDDVPYAVFDGDDERVHTIDTDVKKSCWYEWTNSARYAYYYLKNQKNVSCVGGFGIKHGATVLWQLAALEKLKCAVAAFGAGWRAYRGYHKFAGAEPELTDELYRYIAGVEPQSYAKYVSCPILTLGATNNRYFDIDRAYDTVQRIEKTNEKYVNYSVQCDRYLDVTGYNDVFIFFEKYLRGANIFLPSETDISCYTENGYIYVKVKPDRKGLAALQLYASEETFNPALRCWNVTAEKVGESKDETLYRYSPYKYSGQVFFFASANYETGFTVCSRIVAKPFAEDEIVNSNKSNIIFSSRENKYLMQPYANYANDVVAYMREKPSRNISINSGAFDIEGITCPEGLRSLKINNKKDKPRANSILLVDIYAPEGGTLKVGLTENYETDDTLYFSTAVVSGGEIWHRCSFEVSKFKTVEGMNLKGLDKVNSIVFEFDGKYLLNNVIWV